LGDLEETKGYLKFEDELLDRTVWRTGFGRGCGCVLKLLDDGDNNNDNSNNNSGSANVEIQWGQRRN
jgi:hypothetical protein